MAKAKKPRKPRNPGKNKKKLVSKKEPEAIQEFAGFRIGQEVWVRMDIYGTTEWAFGSIIKFHPTDKMEPSFSFFDKIKKRWTVGALSKITESPPKKWMGKL